MKIAVIAISKRGVAASTRLLDCLPEAEIFIKKDAEKYLFTPADIKINFFESSVAELVKTLWNKYNAFVFFTSVGIAVRTVSSFIQNKHVDPAVISVDDSCRFAVSILSGHKGKANILALKTAKHLGAQPVITTASDSLGKISIDLLGEQFGWRASRISNYKKMAAAIVNDEPVVLYADEGIDTSFACGHKNIFPVNTINDIFQDKYSGAIIISDRKIPEETALKSAVFRPAALSIGIGCNKGTSPEEIEEAFKIILDETGYSTEGVRNIATIDIKKEEEGLIKFAENSKIPILFFTKEQISAVTAVTGKSEIVKKHIGVSAVCEPCAILASNNGKLIKNKIKTKNVTCALALGEGENFL